MKLIKLKQFYWRWLPKKRQLRGISEQTAKEQVSNNSSQEVCSYMLFLVLSESTRISPPEWKQLYLKHTQLFPSINRGEELFQYEVHHTPTSISVSILFQLTWTPNAIVFQLFSILISSFSLFFFPRLFASQQHWRRFPREKEGGGRKEVERKKKYEGRRERGVRVGIKRIHIAKG